MVRGVYIVLGAAGSNPLKGLLSGMLNIGA